MPTAATTKERGRLGRGGARAIMKIPSSATPASGSETSATARARGPELEATRSTRQRKCTTRACGPTACAAARVRRATRTGRPSKASTGTTKAKGVLKLANGDVYEGHFAANGRHGLGECTYADGSQFIGEWRDDKPDTDAGKWVGVSEIEDLAETYKGQATKKGYFSRSPGRKYQLGAARVVPDMY